MSWEDGGRDDELLEDSGFTIGQFRLICQALQRGQHPDVSELLDLPDRDLAKAVNLVIRRQIEQLHLDALWRGEADIVIVKGRACMTMNERWDRTNETEL